MTGALVTRKKTLSLYCEFLLAGSGFFSVTPRACVTFQLLRCKGKIQLLMQDASVGTVHTVYFSKHKKQMGNFGLNDFCSFAMSIHCRQTRMAQFSMVCTSFSPAVMGRGEVCISRCIKRKKEIIKISAGID